MTIRQACEKGGERFKSQEKSEYSHIAFTHAIPFNIFYTSQCGAVD